MNNRLLALFAVAGFLMAKPCQAIELKIVSPAPRTVYSRNDSVQCKVNVDWGDAKKKGKTRNVMISANGKLYPTKSEDGKTYIAMVDMKDVRSENLTIDAIASEARKKHNGASLSSGTAFVTVYMETPYAVLSDSLLDDAANVD